jgi:hypothetical protein
MTPDNSNLLSCFKHKVRPEITMVSYFHLVERGSALLAIKSLKWCHLDALLIAVIIRNSANFKHSSHFSGKEMTQALNMSSST